LYCKPLLISASLLLWPALLQRCGRLGEEPIQDTDVLLAFAQVAAAFTGFSGVVAVFGQEHRRIHPIVAAAWLQRMLEFALLVLVFSILSVVIGRFGALESPEWRWLSLSLALVWALTLMSSLRRIRQARTTDLPLGRYRVGRYREFFVFAANAVALVGLIANGFGSFGTCAAAIYLATLAYALILSAVLFLQLLRGFIPDGSEPQER